jgi:hypothetical protein
MRRTALAPLALLLAAAGCSDTGGAVTASASPAPPSAPQTTSALPASSASPSTPSASAGDPQRCHHGEIALTAQGAPGGGAAGSQYVWIVLRNTSSRTCTLYGYPGVSWVTGDDGRQVNQPAERDTSTAPQRVELPPGQAAHAQMRSPQPGNFPDTCRPADVRGYRVYLPDETAADFVAFPLSVCSAEGIGRAEIGPVVAGLSG